VSVAAFDAFGDELGWALATAPSNGTVSGSGTDFSYAPAPDFHGVDSFVVEVSDGNGGTDTATVSVTVRPLNDAPVADSAAIATPEDTPVTFELTASDVDGDALTFEVTPPPAHGSLSCSAASCTFTPVRDFDGGDVVVFRATDPSGASGTVTVSITVTPVNDPPIADDLLITTDEDVPVGITLTATDVDGDPLTFVAGTPTHGVVTGASPSILYEPSANFFGDDSFAFDVADGQGAPTPGPSGSR
jgi:Bacterial Ig domain